MESKTLIDSADLRLEFFRAGRVILAGLRQAPVRLVKRCAGSSLMYSDQEKDEIILDYFGTPGSEGQPQCPACGESLHFKSVVIPYFGLQLEVRCEGCKKKFEWSQPQPERPWKELHLGYFIERYLAGDLIRCPFDDSYVTHAEFSDSVIQFNCPYCNRRGKVKLALPDD